MVKVNPRSFILGLLMLSVCLVSGAFARDPKQVDIFRKANRCPSTGLFTGPCPGFRADHVIPICLFPQFDLAANLKWQSQTESYIKDLFEREMCAMKRKLEGK